MHLQDLFEKKDSTTQQSTRDKMHDVKILDPVARRIMDKARTQYAYTESDLEAFVKLMQVEQERDKSHIKGLEDGLDHAQKINKQQTQELVILKQQEKEDRKVYTNNRNMIDSIRAELDSLEDRTDFLSLTTNS